MLVKASDTSSCTSFHKTLKSCNSEKIMISKILSLWHITQSSLLSVQLKEWGNNTLQILFQIFAKIREPLCYN